jgi:hypothetical protein
MPRKEKLKPAIDKQRRKLLKFLGLGSAVAMGHSAAAQIRVNNKVLENREVLANQVGNFISIKLLRPEDLLSLELRYYNFDLVSQTLKKKANPAYLVVIFQPQSISEQAWNETASGLETPTVPGRIMIGGDSRLVFQIPASITSIPLNLIDLLDWEKYDLVVNGRAKQPAWKIVVPASSRKINNIRGSMNSMSPGRTCPMQKSFQR